MSETRTDLHEFVENDYGDMDHQYRGEVVVRREDGANDEKWLRFDQHDDDTGMRVSEYYERFDWDLKRKPGYVVSYAIRRLILTLV